MKRNQKSPYPKNLKLFDLVEVYWQDAHSDGAWSEYKDALRQEQMIVRNVGYFAGWTEQDEFIISNMQALKDNMLGWRMYIPRGMVKRVIKIKH